MGTQDAVNDSSIVKTEVHEGIYIKHLDDRKVKMTEKSLSNLFDKVYMFKKQHPSSKSRDALEKFSKSKTKFNENFY